MTAVEFAVPIRVCDSAGLSRDNALLQLGVPWPRGVLWPQTPVALRETATSLLPVQTKSLECWPDGSVKWLLVSALLDTAPLVDSLLHLVPLPSPEPRNPLQVEQTALAITLRTGSSEWIMPTSGPLPLSRVADTALAPPVDLVIQVTDVQGQVHEVCFEQARLEDAGPLLARVVLDGRVPGVKALAALNVQLALQYTAGHDGVGCEVTVWNTRAARHPGGLWDLGDPGSCYFRDLSVRVRHGQPDAPLQWSASAAPGSGAGDTCTGDWTLYQDSSGGEQWNSPNHVGSDGRSTVRFPGYQVRSGEAVSTVLAEGLRATPVLCVGEGSQGVGVAVGEFWQNFPKALRRRAAELQLALFPGEAAVLHELQGGEQKRHALWLQVGAAAALPVLSACHQPLAVSVDASWIEHSAAIPGFTAASDTDDLRYQQYLADMLDGHWSVAAKRERIDEYGWRNFGDLHADHEAARSDAAQLFPSHYNNQYDFIQGAFLHAQRTADPRWQALLREAARHTIDIDLYRTAGDRAVFNGGLFWHTDHYVPAATSSHRTYSRANAGAGPYGGGPSNEHNYTTGLLHYYLSTGDAQARRAVLQLADWVLAMDDGSQTLFGCLDAGPTGVATATVDPDYQKPGRGAGNSINALLDAWRLTHSHHYLSAAEALLQRCIHPHDDLAALALDQPEKRWSYLVFLQVLARYLDIKLEWQEHDYAYFHGRDSLLAYARWMQQHERPYADVLDRVEIPSETWPAHDLRKAHVLYAAARYLEADEATALRERARYFHQRSLTDVLAWPTARYTRPQVLLAVYGLLPYWYERPQHLAPLPLSVRRAHQYDFGVPVPFRTQRARLAATLRSRVSVLGRELSRTLRDRWLLWRPRS